MTFACHFSSSLYFQSRENSLLDRVKCPLHESECLADLRSNVIKPVPPITGGIDISPLHVRQMQMGRVRRLLIWVPLMVFLALFFVLLNLRYPLLGHDYRFFIPFLTEGRWYLMHEGFAPVRFAVHLCGGFSLYGDPNDLFYSLTQLLAAFFTPWIAIQASVAIMLVAGYFGWKLVGRDVLNLNDRWQHVLALIICSCGFYFSHIIVGHANFISFPLLGFLFWLLFDRRSDTTKTLILRVAGFTLLSGIILYGAGYFTMMTFGLLVFLILPLDAALHGRAIARYLRRTLWRALLFFAGALLIGISKIVAVVSLLVNVHYAVTMPAIRTIPTTLLYAFNALWALPQTGSLFPGIPWGLQEKSMYLSPVVLVGLFGALGIFLTGARWKGSRWQRIIFAVHALLVAAVFTQLIQGKGIAADAMYHLFGSSDFRVSMRMLYAASIWLSVLAVTSLAHIVREPGERGERAVVAVCLGVTVLGFVAAYLPVLRDFDLSFNDQTYANVLRENAPTSVRRIMDSGYHFGDTSSYTCSWEGLFLVAHEPQKRALHVGPVTDVTDGAYNLVNPSCYQYGDENGCLPGDPISVTDGQNFENFRNGLPVTWKLSFGQRLADAISLVTLIACLGTCLIGIASIRRRKTSASKKAAQIHKRRS